MNDAGSFTPRPRAPGARVPSAHDRANIAAELDAIAARLEQHVIGSARSEFSDGSVSYDAASMAIVRLSALLERPDAAELAARLGTDEVRAIRTMRNIISGYATMRDEDFWITATRELPELLARLGAPGD